MVSPTSLVSAIQCPNITSSVSKVSIGFPHHKESLMKEMPATTEIVGKTEARKCGRSDINITICFVLFIMNIRFYTLMVAKVTCLISSSQMSGDSQKKTCSFVDVGIHSEMMKEI